ncbi:hypothetical protein PanWU01x14_191840, partial [Parasponia andersonii]
HLATIINHSKGTFLNNTDSTLEEKFCTTTTCSSLYSVESIFELQEKEGDGRNATIQSDMKHHMNINTISYEENLISRPPLMRKLRIEDLREEFS